MAYTPESYTPVHNKSEIRWVQNGEDGDELVLNRPIDDIANMVITVANEVSSKQSIKLANEGNLSYATYTADVITGFDDNGTFIADLTNTSTVVTLKSPYTTEHLQVGAELSGTGIGVGTTIAEITSSTEIVMSLPATATVIDATVAFVQTIELLYIDGIRVENDDRILLKDQTIATQNGIYVVTNKGSDITPWVLTRSEDANTWNKLSSVTIAVDQGTMNKDTVWFCTANKDGGVIGTDDILFTGLGGSGQMLGKARVRVFSYNAQLVEENVTVPYNVNSSAVGPVVVMDGYTLTVEDGARVVIL